MRIIILLSLLLLFFTSCNDSKISGPEDDSHDNQRFTPPSLQLVNVGRTSFNDLQKPLNNNIDFDSVFATKTRDYILLNNGTADAIDVTFNSSLLEIEPDSIGRIPGRLDSTLSAYPLIFFTIPHVIPSTGVGALLPFDLGEFSESISLTYSYEDEQGSIVSLIKLMNNQTAA
jgi:hypothetical protein